MLLFSKSKSSFRFIQRVLWLLGGFGVPKKSLFDITAVIDYWNMKPCNSGHSTHLSGSREFHEQVTKKRYLVEPHIKEFAHFQEMKGRKILEIGSGIGTDAFQFAMNGAIVKSGDISSRSIEICEETKANLQVQNITFFNHDFENSDLPIEKDFSPDLIYSFGVIHHSPNPNIIFSNISHWGKSGTQVRIMVYSRVSTKAIALYIKYGYRVGFNFDRAVALQSEAQYGSPYTHTYTAKSVRKILEANNIKVIEIYKKHIFQYQIDLYKKNIYKKKLYWRIIPNFILKKLENSFGWHLLVIGEVL